MGLNAKDKPAPQGNRVAQPPLENGSYPARLVQVIDLGVQPQDAFEGKEKPPVQKLKVTYELVDSFMIDEEGNELEDKPRWLSEDFAFYSLDQEQAKSTKRYYALDPNGEKEGDWSALIAAPVVVTIVQNPGKGKNKGKIYEKIVSTSAMRAKEAAKLPKLKNEGKVFSIDDLDTVDVFFTFPDWIQKLIKEGLEFEGSPMAKAIANYKKADGKKEEKKAAPKDNDEPPFDVDKGVENEGENEEW